MKNRKIKVIALLFVLVGSLAVIWHNLSMSEVNAETNNEIVFDFKKTTETIKLAQNVSFYSKLNKKNLPKDAEIEWYSSDDQIAPVYDAGIVAGLGRGQVEIKAVLKGTNYSTSCIVNIVPGDLNCYLKDSGKKISSHKCEKGESFAVRVNDQFNSINENELFYYSYDEEVAIVDQSGNVTTKNAGKTKIVATLKGNNQIKKELRLEVTTAVSDVKIYENNYETYIGDRAQIDFEVYPANATNKNVKFEVEDKKIATVSSNGKIQGKNAGETTIKIISKSNPEIQREVEVKVEEQRDYKLVDIGQVPQKEEYDLRYVKKGETIKIPNNYSDNVKLTCNNNSLINYEVTNNHINITGIERGVAILQITDNGVVDNLKILVNKYIDDETTSNSIPVSKLILPVRSNDLLEGMTYTNNTSIAVGQTCSFKVYISPINASVDDLQYSISNEKDFVLSSIGSVTAINPNKTTKFTVSSKSNPAVTQTITLKSEIGNVKKVEFAKKYIGDNSLDINKSKGFPFNPIFYMESGKILDPTKEDLSNNETYKKLLRNIKIKTNSTDILKVSNNIAYPIEGRTGIGRLELVYNEGKENEKRATTEFESNGIITETIAKIKFAKSEYKINEGGDWNFNPIIVTNTNKTYNPEKLEVRESQEYKNLLSKIQIEKVAASNGYLGTGNLVRIIGNNTVKVVYEGKCKLRMVVSGTDISAETILNIKFNDEVEKNVNSTRYVGAKLVSLVSDKNSPSSSSVIDVSKGTEVFAYEKYKSGWVRVKYQENDQLYIMASNLVESPPYAENNTGSIEKNINDYRYISSDGVMLSPVAGAGNAISIPKATKIYVFEKYKNGWARVEYQGNNQLYIDANKNLAMSPPAIATGSNRTGIVIVSTRLNVRALPNNSADVLGKLYSGSTVSIIDKENNWFKISYNGSEAYVSADFVRECESFNSSGTPVPTSDNATVQKILDEAHKHLGVPYVYGGTTPNGFDCSGFVQYVYKQCGINISRTAASQWTENGVKVAKSDLQPGDLVFFGTGSVSVSHVGIYTGNNQYIHSPHTGDKVKYSSLSGAKNCLGGKRIIK